MKNSTKRLEKKFIMFQVINEDCTSISLGVGVKIEYVIL